MFLYSELNLQLINEETLPPHRWPVVKTRLPGQETPEMWVRSLGGEDPLEKGMATQPSILAWRIPWTEVPGLQSMGVAKSRTKSD